MIAFDINRFFELLAADNPNPKCELDYKNSFTLMVAIILSAQATDKSVNKITPALFALADTPDKMLNLGVDGLTPLVKTINYYNNKAKNILQMSAVLKEKFNNLFPTTLDGLQQLPGVGRKSANVFLNVTEDAPTIAVDTHVFRIANRLGIAVGSTPFEVEKKLQEVVPEQYKTKAAHWMVLLGRYTCKAQNPKCYSCPVMSVCPHSPKTLMPIKKGK